MDMKITPAPLGGTVRAIPSKSRAHRALICAALADAPTRIVCGGESDDIAATAACLSALGAVIEKTPEGYAVTPIARTDADMPATLPCRESGSTLRFLLPIVGALGREAAFLPLGRLPERPLSPLYEELARHGCELSPQGGVPLSISGRLSPGRYELAAGVSSQFISGLLFALPLLAGNSELRLTGRAESLPYIDMTLAALEEFGIKIKRQGNVFLADGRQSCRSPGVAGVEGDWSNAAFWLCAGAIGGGSVSCAGLNLQSAQGDKAVMELLARFGARVTAESAAVSVSGGRLRGIEIDASDIPDLVPVLAAVGCVAGGTTVIRNAGRLRMKESDRLSAITSVLNTLGGDVLEREDGLLIRGGVLTGGEVPSWGDHRIAMAVAVAATVCKAPVTVKDAHAVNKSYPGFFDDLRLLGGNALEI